MGRRAYVVIVVVASGSRVSVGLTLRGYARHRKATNLPGSTLKAVQRAVESKRIPVNTDGTINAELADAEWEKNTIPRSKDTPTNDPVPERRQSSASSQSDYLEARSRKEWALAKKRELELEQARGELVTLSFLRDQVTRILTALSEAHNNIPGTWLARLEACRDTAERRAVLETGVEQIKAELTQLGESIAMEIDAAGDAPDRSRSVA